MHTDAKQFYALLGLDPTCTDEDIRFAFRRRAKELHPDAESGNASAFIRLKRAYDILSDPAQRARYDRASRPGKRQARRDSLDLPPPSLRTPRAGGISFARYFVAFLFMGGLSFGAIAAMISFVDVPPAASFRTATPARPAATETAKGDHAGPDNERVGPGFWDPAAPNGTPHDSAAPRRAPTGSLANSASE